MANVTASNLVLGPATLYRAEFGNAAEPADTSVVPDPAIWTDMGGTLEGVTIAIEQEFTDVTADQIIDAADARLTSRSITVTTRLPEVTLENLRNALSGGTVTTTNGVTKYEAAIGSSASPLYEAILIDGPGVDGKRCYTVLRKVISVGSVEWGYSKDGQTAYSVTWKAFYVDSTTGPFGVISGEPTTP